MCVLYVQDNLFRVLLSGIEWLILSMTHHDSLFETKIPVGCWTIVIFVNYFVNYLLNLALVDFLCREYKKSRKEKIYKFRGDFWSNFEFCAEVKKSRGSNRQNFWFLAC